MGHSSPLVRGFLGTLHALIFSAGVIACGAPPVPAPDPGGTLPVSGSAGAPGAKRPAPLKASVAQAFFVGGTLHIKVRLLAVGSLPSDSVVVGVLGLREGQVVEKQYARLLETTGDKTFIRDNSALLSFELRAENLTEYQVRCSWGQEAEQIWAEHSAEAVPAAASAGEETGSSVSESPDARALAPSGEPAPDESVRALDAPEPKKPSDPVLTDVELDEKEQQCGAPPCDLEYTLRVRLVNESPETISDIRLAVGISWSESKNLPKSPAHGLPPQSGEEVVHLKDTVLQPGQAKKLKVKVARAVPVVPGGAFLPYIRLIGSRIAN